MFQKSQFQRKLFVSLALLIALLFVVSAIVLDHTNAENIRRTWENNGRYTFNSLVAALDDTITEMDNVTKELHGTQQLFELFRALPPERTQNDFDLRLRDKALISGTIFGAIGPGWFDGQITIVSRYGDYVALDNRSGRISLSSRQALALPAVQWGLSTTEYLRCFPPHSNEWHTDHAPIFTLARPLRDAYGTYGVILYSRPISALDKICAAYLQDTDSYAALLEANGAVLYEYAPEFARIPIGRWYSPEKLNESGQAQYYIDHTQVNLHRIATANWLVANLRGGSLLQSQILQFRTALTASYCIALLCVLLLLYGVMRYLTVPLRRLRARLDDISLDSTLALPPPVENDEINALSNAISAMMQRFRTQNENLLAAREREMRSHYNAMEAQLNSHFLYNTLAIIGAVGQMEGSETTPRLCARLADLLRYSVDYNFKCVTLHDEFKNVRDYLEIMAARFDGQTDFVWDIDPATENIKVPKLILQPIVENCFKHGFADTEGIRRIVICARREDTHWTVAIANNGTPPTAADIAALNARFAHEQAALAQSGLDAQTNNHFGLTNTLLRLHIFYRGKEFFRMESAPDQTEIEIGGPIHAD